MNELMREITSTTELSEAFKWAADIIRLQLPGRVALFVGPPRRTREQNDKIWPMLRDIAKHVPWANTKLDEHEWKDLITAVLKKQRVVPGIDGGVVVLGGHTSRMSIAEVSDMIEFMYAFGTEHNVVWSEKSKRTFLDEQKRRAKQ